MNYFLLYVVYCFVHFGVIISIVISFFLFPSQWLQAGGGAGDVGGGVPPSCVLCSRGFCDTTVCDCHVCLGEPSSFNLFLLSPPHLLFPHQ